MKKILILAAILLLLFTGCARNVHRVTEAELESELIRKASQPSEAHEIFRELHGDWETKSTYWSDESSAPDVSKGRASARLIFDGRFVREEFFGKALGRPLNGMGILGYDNVKGEYTSVWIDSLSTAVSVSTGTLDELRHTFTFHGSYVDPISHQTKQTRTILEVPNRDLHRLQVFETGKKGKEIKTLEVEYSRTGILVLD